MCSKRPAATRLLNLLWTHIPTRMHAAPNGFCATEPEYPEHPELYSAHRTVGRLRVSASPAVQRHPTRRARRYLWCATQGLSRPRRAPFRTTYQFATHSNDSNFVDLRKMRNPPPVVQLTPAFLVLAMLGCSLPLLKRTLQRVRYVRRCRPSVGWPYVCISSAAEHRDRGDMR